MAEMWETVEHWTSGVEYTDLHRDLWLNRRVGLWASGWQVVYRRGGPGKPHQRQWYASEDAARAALADRMRQCEAEWGGADWRQD